MSTDEIVTPHWIGCQRTAHTLPVPDSREHDFMLDQTVVLRLHDIGMSFRTRMKISLCHSYWDELAPV